MKKFLRFMVFSLSLASSYSFLSATNDVDTAKGVKKCIEKIADENEISSDLLTQLILQKCVKKNEKFLEMNHKTRKEVMQFVVGGSFLFLTAYGLMSWYGLSQENEELKEEVKDLEEEVVEWKKKYQNEGGWLGLGKEGVNKLGEMQVELAKDLGMKDPEKQGLYDILKKAYKSGKEEIKEEAYKLINDQMRSSMDSFMGGS